VEAFVKNLAKDRGKSVAEVEKDFFMTVRPGSLIQRFATTEEVANMVAYVASPLSSATNGAALRVEGGCVPSIL
jgi:NAD(P)-dependent dehydrogenase (short-subunit alcohol dehydrogenase family)